MSGSVVSAVCSIIVADLNDQPAYKCLSYTWGEPTHTGAILLDGAEFPVGQNLFGATTYLSTCPSARISPIWIDEVCINQQDLQERSQQVGMMRRIHSQAEEVLVWLGPATALDSVAIPLTKRLARKELDSIRHFYDRPWFERIWVIQEAVLA
ncbi:heterokaryon incompatibility, partial [Tothia fuscella]